MTAISKNNSTANADSSSPRKAALQLPGQPISGNITEKSSNLAPIQPKEKAVDYSAPRTRLSSPISPARQAVDVGQSRDRHIQESTSSSDLFIIRGLQQRIASLQQQQQQQKRGSKYRMEEEEATRVQIIYKVYCRNNKGFSCFVDPPLRYGDGSKQTFHLHGQIPFPSDINLFVERQRGALSFLVYKKLYCCQPRLLEQDSPVEEHWFAAQQEDIQVTSERLYKAYAFLRKRYPDELKYFPEFKVGSRISSPFLFYFSKRSFIMGLNDLPDEHMSQIRLFREHIETSFRYEFANIDNLISSGDITAEYLAYLFEPGTVVVKKKGAAYAGYEQVDWPKRRIPRPKRGTFRYMSDDMENSDAETSSDQLSIQGQCWHFDGEFIRNWDRLFLDFGESRQRVKPISELVLLPLRFAGLEVAEELRRRGSIFWSCRARRFVSYNIDSNLAEERVTSERFFELHRQD